MEKIGSTIVEEGIKDLKNLKERKTVRAVIYEHNKICMLYSGLFNDYTFPGGGLKDNESHEEALQRELKEEFGANEVKVIKPLGYTEEIRFGLNKNDSKYRQISYYYLCEIANISKPTFVGRELEQDLKKVCLNLDDVIKHNDAASKSREAEENKGFMTVLKRESLILNYLKEVLL